ncbi:M14 family metallopeptidase [Agaribacter flavus]|uniref:M14 family metallocarboxypeptidase n=1 Tax=Agaribacter flavus TaxID=1902781 RepID=A0ABV7FV44_9ALTE
MSNTHYPIGQAGIAWQSAERKAWLAQQKIKRSYFEEVMCRFDDVPPQFKKINYGNLPYDKEFAQPHAYPLFAFVPQSIDGNKPSVLISGGVHGYETSGVQGACEFLIHHASQFLDAFNVVVAPCISPWAYETINRWNPMALDPNRSFYANSPVPECSQLMDFLNGLGLSFLAHIDLHETTDTDDSEFRPALAARDGITLSNWGIPDGFYLVADSRQAQPDFQAAIIDAVSSVTHIAPADEKGQLIGSDAHQHGVICYDKKGLNLCGGITDASFVTTTEVYPDSLNATPEICIAAQVAALDGALNYLMKV